MSFLAGNASRVMLGGYELSGYFDKVTMTRQQALFDTSVLNVNAETYLPTLYSGDLMLTGLFDGAASPNNVADVALDAAFTATKGAPFAYAPMGWGVGNVAYIGICNESDSKVTSPIKGYVATEASVKAEGASAGTQGPGSIGYAINRGQCLTTWAATSMSGAGTSQDGGASSSNGAMAAFFATGWVGTTPTWTGEVDHSSDNVTFVALVTSQNFSGSVPASQLLAVAPGTTINRYVEPKDTIGGTGGPSVTRLIAFARF